MTTQPPTDAERSRIAREAFIAGAQWADDQCPVHAYGKLVTAEADKRYPAETA